ncbi:MAG: 2Fe-2S iron-sulfur cluster-binding protein [Myxococcota bacterium]
MHRLRFLPSGREIRVKSGVRLIDAVRHAGLPIARACGDELVCARCGVRILEGHVTRAAAVERRAAQRNDLGPELRLACAIRVHDDLTLHADYWGPLE